MAQALVMPRQGNTVESCIIVRWKAAEGQPVTAETVVCEVETDKATFDVPAGSAGVLLKILHPEGDDVPVLAPIAVVGQAGEDWKAAVEGSVAAAASAPSASAQPAPEPAAPRQAQGDADPGGSAPATPAPLPAAAGARSPASPRARKLAAAEALDAGALAGTGPGGRVIARDVVAAVATRPALTSAARAAVAAGARVPASGTALGGRVGLSDLQAAAAAPAPALALAAPVPTGEDRVTETPLRGIRKIISERMLASLSTTAQVSFHMGASAARLQALRARFKGSEPALGFNEVTIGDLVLFAVSRVLPRFPQANATLEKGVLRAHERVHLALAVDTPRGLLVPVIRNADLLSLRQLSAEAKRLAQACLQGKIDPAELSGGTFSVSNLGALGIESFTPVLNAPQVAILGVNTIVQQPFPRPDGSVGFEPRIGLSLTADHQVLDGAPAARLLKAFAEAIGDIDLLLA